MLSSFESQTAPGDSHGPTLAEPKPSNKKNFDLEYIEMHADVMEISLEDPKAQSEPEETEAPAVPKNATQNYSATHRNA